MSNMLPTSYQEFIHKSRYARWLEEEGRRENWGETVSRYVDFMEEALLEKHNYKIKKGDFIKKYGKAEYAKMKRELQEREEHI